MMLKVLLLTLCVGYALAGCRNRVVKNRLTASCSNTENSQYATPSEFIPKWSGGDFNWPDKNSRSLLKSSGKYVSKNVIATRAVMHNDDVLLALPRYKKGVPATLAKLSMKDCNQTLIAFPCWDLQEEGNCKALQSVVDIYLDNNDYLWVLDTGIVNSFEENPIRKCGPKVVAIDLLTGNVVKTVDLSSLSTTTSRLQYVVADYTADNRIFIYVTDAASRAILVYEASSKSPQGFRVVLPGAISIGSEGRDILYPALLRDANGEGILLFSYLSSLNLFAISTHDLQNGVGRIVDIGSKPNNMVILGTDNGSGLFFRYEGKPDIYQWDSRTVFCKNNLKKLPGGDDTGCSLATHVFPDYRLNKMRVLESNYPDFIEGAVGCGVDHSISILP